MMIAQGIAETTGVPLGDRFLVRLVNSSTQTRKTREERWENVRDIFALKHGEELEGKYVLLVDDVLTTGSTLEACAVTLSTVPGIRIGCATAACVG